MMVYSTPIKDTHSTIHRGINVTSQDHLNKLKNIINGVTLLNSFSHTYGSYYVTLFLEIGKNDDVFNDDVFRWHFFTLALSETHLTHLTRSVCLKITYYTFDKRNKSEYFRQTGPLNYKKKTL